MEILLPSPQIPDLELWQGQGPHVSPARCVGQEARFIWNAGFSHRPNPPGSWPLLLGLP